VVGGNHHHQKLISSFDDYDLRLMPAFDVLGLRDALRSDCLGVVQDFVMDLLFIQAIEQPLWYFHDRLLDKIITFLIYL
jgi:hypothetical protein